MNMGKITDISRQRYNKSRVSVYIDGEFVCGLDAVTAAAARIKIGDEITAERLKEVVRSSEINCAFERAVWYISRTPHTQKQTAEYLNDKGYEKEITDEAIARMLTYRYLDDEQYARSFFRSKCKKYGTVRITAELKRNGVSQDIIDAVLDEEQPQDNSIIEVAEKYIRSHRTADKQRLKRFLAGRGYTWGEISDAVRELEKTVAFDDADDDF